MKYDEKEFMKMSARDRFCVDHARMLALFNMLREITKTQSDLVCNPAVSELVKEKLAADMHEIRNRLTEMVGGIDQARCDICNDPCNDYTSRGEPMVCDRCRLKNYLYS